MQRLSTWYRGASSLSVEMASTTDLTSTTFSPEFSITQFQFWNWTKTNWTIKESYLCRWNEALLALFLLASSWRPNQKNKHSSFWNTPEERVQRVGLGFWGLARILSQLEPILPFLLNTNIIFNTCLILWFWNFKKIYSFILFNFIFIFYKKYLRLFII